MDTRFREVRSRWRPVPTIALVLAAIGAPTLRAQDVDRILRIVRSIPETVFTRRPGESPAATPGTAARAEESDEPFVPALYLTNGNVIRGHLLAESLPVETPFGTLRIPVEELLEARFHVEPSDARREELAAAIARLGHEDFEVRDAATRELEKIGPDSIPFLREALTDDDEEVRLRAESLLKKVESSAAAPDGLDAPLLDGLDRVRTRRSTVQGVVSVEALEVETRLGRLRVPRVELRRVVFRVTGARSETLTIPDSASVPDRWLTTRIRVQKGDRLRIEASGRMTNPPYSYSAGPDGYGRSSRMLPSFKILSLVGKIGPSGTPFLVGSSYDQRAPATGVLYLGVVPYRYGSLQGSFRATIRAR